MGRAVKSHLKGTTDMGRIGNHFYNLSQGYTPMIPEGNVTVS